jgi:hypothetical protein
MSDLSRFGGDGPPGIEMAGSWTPVRQLGRSGVWPAAHCPPPTARRVRTLEHARDGYHSASGMATRINHRCRGVREEAQPTQRRCSCQHLAGELPHTKDHLCGKAKGCPGAYQTAPIAQVATLFRSSCLGKAWNFLPSLCITSGSADQSVCRENTDRQMLGLF